MNLTKWRHALLQSVLTILKTYIHMYFSSKWNSYWENSDINKLNEEISLKKKRTLLRCSLYSETLSDFSDIGKCLRIKITVQRRICK